jgi:hypothetical protein
MVLPMIGEMTFRLLNKMLYKDEGRKTEHDKVLHNMLIDARQSSLWLVLMFPKRQGKRMCTVTRFA